MLLLLPGTLSLKQILETRKCFDKLSVYIWLFQPGFLRKQGCVITLSVNLPYSLTRTDLNWLTGFHQI